MAKDWNVILISLDDVRQDHLGCYGYSRNTSPHIDALAKKGVQFDQAIAASFWTLPTHASMLSGLSLLAHGADSPQHKIKNDVVLLPQILQKQGFKTAGIVSIDYVSDFYGFNRGFDFFKKFVSGKKERRNAEQVVSEAFNWLNENKDNNFFMFLHFIDAHEPRLPPEDFMLYSEEIKSINDYANLPVKFNSKFDRELRKITPVQMAQEFALYDSEINYVDSQIGRLIDFLNEKKLLDKTFIIVVADHGEQFREHDDLGHSTFWEEVIKVPLIFFAPNAFKAKKIEQLVRHVDLMPSILDFLEIKASENLEGVSLLPAITGNIDLGLSAVCQGLGIHSLPSRTLRNFDFCLRTSKWKYFEKTLFLIPLPRFLRPGRGFRLNQFKTFALDSVALIKRLLTNGFRYKTKGLYDLENDPQEKNNLVKKQPELAQKMRQEVLDYWKQVTGKVSVQSVETEKGTQEAEEVKKRLEALGYMD